MAERKSGFQELQHTADAALRVWGNSLEELFQCALDGMYQLIGISSNLEAEQAPFEIALEVVDLESLLVSFLTECLYFVMDEGLRVMPESLFIEENRLHSVMKPLAVVSVSKEIKAVTYHKMKIDQIGQRFEVTIVFDL